MRYLSSMTRIINARFFDNKHNLIPTRDLGIEIWTIIEAKEIILLENGETESMALKVTMEGPVSSKCPCFVMQVHNNALVVCDDEAYANYNLTHLCLLTGFERKQKTVGHRISTLSPTLNSFDTRMKTNLKKATDKALNIFFNPTGTLIPQIF